MLRAAVLIVAAALAAGGLLAWATGHPQGLPAALWGSILLLATLFERWRYRQASRSPDGPWIATEERFVDPETGRTLQVWYEPHSGARRYVDETQDRSRP